MRHEANPTDLMFKRILDIDINEIYRNRQEDLDLNNRFELGCAQGKHSIRFRSFSNTPLPTYLHTYIPYLTLPYHGIPLHTIPYHYITYNTYHTIPYHTIPYHTIPYHTIPYHTIPYIHTNAYIPIHTITLHCIALHTHTIPYHTIHTYIHDIPIHITITIPFGLTPRAFCLTISRASHIFVLRTTSSIKHYGPGLESISILYSTTLCNKCHLPQPRSFNILYLEARTSSSSSHPSLSTILYPTVS